MGVGLPVLVLGDRRRIGAGVGSICAMPSIGVLFRVFRWWVLGVVAMIYGAVGLVEVLVVTVVTTLCSVASGLCVGATLVGALVRLLTMAASCRAIF